MMYFAATSGTEDSPSSLLKVTFNTKTTWSGWMSIRPLSVHDEVPQDMLASERLRKYLVFYQQYRGWHHGRL